MFKRVILNKQLVGIFLLCLSLTLHVSGQDSIPESEIVPKVDEYMDAAVKVNRFSGSIVIARKGKPIVSKGYGLANIELNVPNTPDTIFRLASITKQFTGMAILILREKGKLSVGDSVCKFVSDCPAAWKPITVKHLLTHTSGIPSYTGFPDFAKLASQPVTNEEMIARFRDKPLEFTPGEKFAYNNSAYFLLGEIIEKTSGKSYVEFLQENIFVPLGMNKTGYDSSVRIIKNRASGYAIQNGEIINAAFLDMSIPYAAGALYSTTGDMLLWDQALYKEKLVSKKSLKEMFTPFKNGYGYGWGMSKRHNRRSISHSGGIFGFATDIIRFPDDSATVVVLSNNQGAPVTKISNDLSAILFGARYEIPVEKKAISVNPTVLATYVGDYKVEQPSVIVKIFLEKGKLVGELAGRTRFALSAETETKFFSKDVNMTIEFKKDPNGKITGLTLNAGGTELPAKKIM